MWIFLLMPCPLIGPFIFRDLVYLYWLVNPCQVLCIWLILPCRSFRPLPWYYVGWPSAYLVSWLPCIWITAVLRPYLCNQGGTVSPFLSRLACQIMSLIDNHGITLIPVYIPTHLNVEADYLSQDQMVPEWHLLPWVAEGAFHLWGLTEVDCWHLFVPLNTSIITSWNLLPLAALGLNAFNHPSMFEISYMFPPSALFPLVLCKFLAEHVKGQLRYLILLAPCWMEAPHSSQHFARCSTMVPHHKRSHHRCFGRPGTQGSVISTFNPLGALWCVLCRSEVSFLSLSGGRGATGVSMSKVYQQYWKEWGSWCFDRVYQTMSSLPLN